jgi:hypothetical protein
VYLAAANTGSPATERMASRARSLGRFSVGNFFLTACENLHRSVHDYYNKKYSSFRILADRNVRRHLVNHNYTPRIVDCLALMAVSVSG